LPGLQRAGTGCSSTGVGRPTGDSPSARGHPPLVGRHSLHYFRRSTPGAHYGFDINTPFEKLPNRSRRPPAGIREENILFLTVGRRYFYTHPFVGILNQLDRRYKETTSLHVRMDLSRYINLRECPTCLGTRLKPEILSVTVGGKNIYEVCRLPIRECLAFLTAIPLSPQELQVTERVMKEIRQRLQFLLDVGMDYLSLERSSGSLSGGEGQRIRLATQIGSGLVGVLYVLDEPTVGLHQRDNIRLIAPSSVCANGEHGPGRGARPGHDDGIRPDRRHRARGGVDGGRVVFQGTRRRFAGADTLTGGPTFRPPFHRCSASSGSRREFHSPGRGVRHNSRMWTSGFLSASSRR
jgi:excinuclease ABC subunit A